jgi:hypothetical protein
MIAPWTISRNAPGVYDSRGATLFQVAQTDPDYRR